MEREKQLFIIIYQQLIYSFFTVTFITFARDKKKTRKTEKYQE